MSEVTRYPLAWPAGRPRSVVRRYGRFASAKPSGSRQDLSIADAIKRLMYELDRIGARNEVISSNVALRLDGMPRSGEPKPIDPGVALYFDLAGKPHCMPCDTYTEVAQNIAAIAAHLEAARAMERYGVATLAEQFTGFQALPAPGKADSQRWRNVLRFNDGTNVSVDMVRERYRELAKEKATSEAALRELNVARDEAVKELSA